MVIFADFLNRKEKYFVEVIS